MNEVIERRLEFLKLEAKGFSLCEIVKILSEKYLTSERNLGKSSKKKFSKTTTLKRR